MASQNNDQNQRRVPVKTYSRQPFLRIVPKVAESAPGTHNSSNSPRISYVTGREPFESATPASAIYVVKPSGATQLRSATQIRVLPRNLVAHSQKKGSPREPQPGPSRPAANKSGLKKDLILKCKVSCSANELYPEFTLKTTTAEEMERLLKYRLKALKHDLLEHAMRKTSRHGRQCQACGEKFATFASYIIHIRSCPIACKCGELFSSSIFYLSHASSCKKFQTE